MLPGLAGIAGFSGPGVALPAPSYVSTSTFSAGSITPTYPASIAAGDFLIGTVMCNASTDSCDYTAPSGFQRLASFLTPSNDHCVVFYKIADGSESGTATFTLVGGGTVSAHSAAVSRFTGATRIEGLRAGGTADYTATPISTLAVTTTVPNSLLVNVFGKDSTGANNITEEAGFTEAFDYSKGAPGTHEWALHYASAPSTGAQTTEEPTAQANSAWGFLSFALNPSGTTDSPSINVRGSRITHVNNANSLTFTLPPGSAEGDLCIIFAQHGFAPTAPTGWGTYFALTGTNINGSVFFKYLTAADVSTGTVSITFSGTYYGQVAGISFVGCTGGLRSIKASRNSAGSTSRSLSTGSNPQTGDYVVSFGSTRHSTATCTTDVGSSLQAQANTNASACLFGGTIGSSGAVTVNFSYSSAGTGDFQSMVVIAPCP